MDTKIIAFSGKLGAGKTSCTNFIHALALLNLVVDGEGKRITPRAWVNPEGKLMVGVDPDTDQEIDLSSRQPEAVQWLAQTVWPFVKPFSCAGPLKDFCVNVLNLNPDHVYGSQEDKKKSSHLKWEDMPLPPNFDVNQKNPGFKRKVRIGTMTVREVVEYFGTEIVRQMYAPAWAKALVRDIQRWNPIIATIDDVRFLTEVEELKAAGAIIIRLTLTTEDAAKNTHQSNVELDDYDGFDFVIDNQNMNMAETFDEIIKVLQKLEWLKPNES